MHDAVSQMPLNEKCLIIENTKRDVDRNRDYQYDLEAYAMGVKEVQYPQYDIEGLPFKPHVELEKCSESFFAETAENRDRMHW